MISPGLEVGRATIFQTLAIGYDDALRGRVRKAPIAPAVMPIGSSTNPQHGPEPGAQTLPGNAQNALPPANGLIVFPFHSAGDPVPVIVSAKG